MRSLGACDPAMDPEQLRIGLGHDTHRLAADRSLVLGGVAIPFDRGTAGHSDADVLLHAVTDALLGAAGLGDIGEWFPDTDPQWAGAESSQLLKTVRSTLAERQWTVINLDCTIFAERPKLKPYKPQMRHRLAELVNLAPEAINIKAKTGEGVGPVGRDEAISATAIVLLARNT